MPLHKNPIHTPVRGVRVCSGPPFRPPPQACMDWSVERHVNASLATFGLAEPTTLDAGAVTGRYRASAVTRESSRKTSAPCPNSRAVINEWPRAAPMPSTAA